ncbi:Transcription factor Iwr1 domain-containing protein [Plasmodiophora brassicae]|uniref:Transcription factor Iwr1 domain-containing protein n=1 Tax=Plasmodiophora brassicae TaxID=37360 RepID=A0A0G4IJP3_PLABS|nr:hypothetical protein PBRA_009656 [Plasmodiophora brassicae]SPR01778.1 unnamed protein product [Plasmodiophora brassicae]
MSGGQAPIVVVRVKRPRLCLPVDDLVVNAPSAKRATTASLSSRFTGLVVASDPSSSAKLFRRIETCNNEQLLDASFQERLRDSNGRYDASAHFRYIDVDPLAPGRSGSTNYERLMEKYRADIGDVKDADEFVWDVFVCEGAASAAQINNSALISIDDDAEPLIFEADTDEEANWDDEDSNASNNPNMSYPEEDTESDDDGVGSDIYDENSLDDLDDYDQS